MHHVRYFYINNELLTWTVCWVHLLAIHLLAVNVQGQHKYFTEVVLQMLKTNEKKLTADAGKVMFSGEMYYYWPLNSVEKSLVKHRFSLHNLLRY